MQHLSKSHSVKINEWVSDLRALGSRPEIVVLQEVKEFEDIDDIERMWISMYIDRGAMLLNENLVYPVAIRSDLDERLTGDGVDKYRAVGKFISERRRNAGLTQKEFAEKIGVALTVIRKIEQGKDNIVLSSLLLILSAFGCSISVDKIK